MQKALIGLVLAFVLISTAFLPLAEARLTTNISGPKEVKKGNSAVVTISGVAGMNWNTSGGVTKFGNTGSYTIQAVIYSGGNHVSYCSTSVNLGGNNIESQYSCKANVYPCVNQSWGTAKYYAKVTSSPNDLSQKPAISNTIAIKCK